MSNSVAMNSRAAFWWPKAIVIFFILVAVFQFYLLSLAKNGASLEFEDRPYERGLAYQDVIRDRQNSLQAELSMSYEFERQGTSGQIRARLNGATALVGEKEMSIELIRPNDSTLDLIVKATSSSNEFSSVVKNLAPGHYFVRTRFNFGGKGYYFESNEVVP